MSDENTRWTIVVDKQTDIKLRTRLAMRGQKKGDLSKFVQAAVKRQLFADTMADIRTGFADLTAHEVEELIDEAVAWARQG